jgi:transposase
VTIHRNSHLSKTAIEVITSVQRRRRWTAEQKERWVAASLEPGTGVSAVARQAGIHPSQLYGWRRQLCARPQPAANFAAVRIAAAPAPNGIPASGTIEVVLIMFVDEARFGRMNRIRPCWAPIGTRPGVAAQLIREYIYLYGAVSPKDGTCVYLIMPTSNTACFQVFLEVLAHGTATRSPGASELDLASHAPLPPRLLSSRMRTIIVRGRPRHKPGRYSSAGLHGY